MTEHRGGSHPALDEVLQRPDGHLFDLVGSWARRRVERRTELAAENLLEQRDRFGGEPHPPAVVTAHEAAVHLGERHQLVVRPALHAHLDLRAGANAYSLDRDDTEAGIAYNGKADLQTVYATANLRVPLSPFRVTAGIFNNGNELKLTSRETSTFEIGSQTYTSDQVGVLRAAATFDDWAPYVGIGFDFRIFDTLGLHIDGGVLRQGTPMVALSADGPIASDPLFQQELAAEREELQNSVDDYDLYPVVSIGLSFNF